MSQIQFPNQTAFLHCTGPIHIWARFPDPGYLQSLVAPNLAVSDPFSAVIGGGGLPVYYVGTCETNPTNDAANAYFPVYTAAGGRMTPTDDFYEGSQELIALDLNRYNETVLGWLSEAPAYGRQINSLQQNGPGDRDSFGLTRRLDRGSMVIQNGGYYCLWLQYSYSGSGPTPPDLPWGWFYYCVTTLGVYTPKQGNGKTKMARLSLVARTLHDYRYFNWAKKTNNLYAFQQIQGLVPI